MKAFRWIIYVLIGMFVAPLLFVVLTPSESGYFRGHIWYSVVGLAPLVVQFFLMPFAHIAGASFVAPSKKVGASVGAAIWAMLNVLGLSSFVHGNPFHLVAVIAGVAGVVSSWLICWRFLRRPNQAPEPTAMAVTPPAAQEPRQP